MKSSIKKLPKSIIELTIEENKENIAKHRKKVLNNLRQNTDIKWFRKWANIPEEILVKNYWEDRIATFVVDEALNFLYQDALRKNNILPISQWEIKEIVSQDPLIVKMHIEVFPEIEIDNKYKKIKIKKTIVSVWDDEVEEKLKQIQTKFTRFEKALDWYKSKMWDKLTIDTQWFDLSWNKLTNTDMQKYPLVLWSNILVPWFEEWLVEKTVWEKVELEIEFPKDYHNKDFAWKKTKFEVIINDIEQSIKPEFSLEFIKNLRGKDLDLDWFKALIKQELFEHKEMNARLEDENKLIDEFLKISKIDFWDSLLKNQIEKVYAEVKQNIISSWAKIADYIASLGLSEEDYIEKNIKPIAIKRLQAELILHKLNQVEQIQADEDEINSEIQKILSRFESSDVLEKLKDLYKPWTKYYEELISRLNYRKLIDSFFE